jgi:hypothetical protein
MDTMKPINEVENYEVIGKTRDILITYSLSDCSELVNMENGSIIAKEIGSDNFDLIVTTDLGENLVIFKALDLETVESFKGKTIVFAGVSEKNNEIEEALLVSKITIETKNKMKMKG